MSLPITTTSYTNMFSAMGTIGIFGASVAWSVIFSSSVRGSVELLRCLHLLIFGTSHLTRKSSYSWAASMFAVGTVWAVAMSIVLITGRLDLSAEKHELFRIFAILTAIFPFAGIILFGVALINLGSFFVGPGWVTIGLSLVGIICACCSLCPC